jgi:hypothetical protein
MTQIDITANVGMLTARAAGSGAVAGLGLEHCSTMLAWIVRKGASE